MRDGYKPVTILVRDDLPDDLRRDLNISRVIDVREAEPKEGENVAGVIVYLRGDDPKPGEKYDGAALTETVEGLMANSLRELWGIMHHAADRHAHFVCKGCGAGFCSEREQYAEMKDGDACPECHIAVVEEIAPGPFVGGPNIADSDLATTMTMLQGVVGQLTGDSKEMLALRTRQVEATERLAHAVASVVTEFHADALRSLIRQNSERLTREEWPIVKWTRAWWRRMRGVRRTSGGEMPRGKW